MTINLWAILVSAISAFVLGGLWYSPQVFGAIWRREANVKDSNKHPALVFGIAFLLSFIAAFFFALFLGQRLSLGLSVGAGFVVGLCWVATSFGINYLFATRSLKLFLIDAGYHTLQFTLYGFILGLWR